MVVWLLPCRGAALIFGDTDSRECSIHDEQDVQLLCCSACHAALCCSAQVGMICSNEPGYYEDGGFGIRVENLLAIEEADTEFRCDLARH